MKKTGLLLVNLGSPDSSSVPDVRRYLREFLMDGRVIDSPWPIRAMVVYGAILPFRPKQSAHAYQLVWTPEGSPLISISRKVLELIRPRFDMPVELAMRYQNPSIPDAVYRLLDAGAICPSWQATRALGPPSATLKASLSTPIEPALDALHAALQVGDFRH